MNLNYFIFYNSSFTDLLSNFTDNYIYEDLIYKNMFHFINPKTEPLKEEKDFFNVTKNKYDAYIVGSDQVWRAKVFRLCIYRR